MIFFLMKKKKGKVKMDFTKLNLEFNNMQNIINKYNKMQNIIRNRIKNNQKEINKLESKANCTKNSIEKESYKFIIVSIKNEIEFLEKILMEEQKDESRQNDQVL